MMTRFFVRHPVTTWMIFSAFVVLAAYAVPKIQIEAMPEVDLPSLTVETQWNGASPKAVQRSITLPVEEAVRGVHGVETLTSESRAGRSVVTAEFKRDMDMDFARLYVNEALSDVRRNLPLNAGQPQIRSFVPEDFQTEQFFSFSIRAKLTPNELREKADDWIVPAVLGIDGVADAQVQGGARSLLKITLDRAKLDLYGITADEVFATLGTLDDLAGAGPVQEFGLEKLVSLRDPVNLDKIANAVVARRGGRSYKLYTLGEVTPSFEDPMYFVRSNGENVVQVLVEKRSGANSVVVSRNLRRDLPEIEADLPFEATFLIEEDEGEDLEAKLRELVGRSGIILLLLFGLLVLSLRQVQLTTIVIGSVLFALVICLSLFYFFQISVNFITISGLTICFGMLLDNSILVLDAIHRRLEALQRAEEAGLSWASKMKVAFQTVVSGTSEVIFPILATTLTTMVAFLSFIFLEGRLALYYVPLAIAVAMAMCASVFVAFGWIPVVLNQTWAGRLVRKSSDGPNELDDAHTLTQMVEDLPNLDRDPGIRNKIIQWFQKLWIIIVPGTIALLIWTGMFPIGMTWENWKDPRSYNVKFWEKGVYQDKIIKGGFFRFPDRETLIFYMRGPDGTDVQVTSEQALKFEEALQPVEEGATLTMNVFGNQAYMEVEFEDHLLRTGIPMLYRALLTDMADNTGGTFVYISGFADTPYIKGTFTGAALNSLIKVSGYNSKRLQQIADDTVAKVIRNRRVRNPRVTSSNRFGRSSNEETVIAIKRDVLAQHGVSVLELVGYVRRLLGLDIPWNMLIDGQQEQVQLAFQDADEIQFSEVAERVIETQSGERVRLGDLVTMETVPLSDSITREDQRYTMFVNWEYVGTDKMRRAYLASVIDSMDLPYGYEAEESRREFITQQEETDLRRTIVLALVFIFMVLAALFESVALPFLVLMSVPLGMVGVVVIFWLTTTPFDSSAKIGLVLLFGVVVNNAILLVSRFRYEAANVLKVRLGGDPEAAASLFSGERKRLGGSDLWWLGAEKGKQLQRAVARATLIRMRSILLTSGTTIVGLVPLLVRFEKSPWQLTWLFDVTLPFRLTWMDSENQDIWENLALASIGGLISSTILIIVVIPTLYYFSIRVSWIGRSIGDWNKRMLRRILRRAPKPVIEPAPAPDPAS